MSNHIWCATMCQSSLLFVLIFPSLVSFLSFLPSPSLLLPSSLLPFSPFSTAISHFPSSSPSFFPSSSPSSSSSSPSSSSSYSSSSSSSSSSSPHCAGSPGCWCTLVHSQKRTGDKGCLHHGGQNIGLAPLISPDISLVPPSNVVNCIMVDRILGKPLRY